MCCKHLYHQSEDISARSQDRNSIVVRCIPGINKEREREVEDTAPGRGYPDTIFTEEQ